VRLAASFQERWPTPQPWQGRISFHFFRRPILIGVLFSLIFPGNALGFWRSIFFFHFHSVK
jgi:hypothetical protein